jgi:hypothetical protein
MRYHIPRDQAGFAWLPYLGGFAFGTLQSIYDTVRVPTPEQAKTFRAFANAVHANAARRQDASGSWFWPAFAGYATHGVLDLVNLGWQSLETRPPQVVPYSDPRQVPW